MFCPRQPGEVRERFRPRYEPEAIPLHRLRLRNQRERRPSYLSNVSDQQLASAPCGPRGAQMAEGPKTREDKGVAQKRAQRDLTESVGTPLVRQKKRSRRRLFGGRGTTRTA